MASTFSDEGGAFQLEQQLLALEASGVADETARRADHAVARDDDRHRVPVERATDGAGGPRLADAGRERPVRRYLAVGDAYELVQHVPLECGHRREVDVDIEGRSLSREVLVELLAHGSEPPRDA